MFAFVFSRDGLPARFSLCLFVAAVCLPGGHVLGQAKKDGPPPPAPVRATIVTNESVTSMQSFIGTVTPIRLAVVGSAVDGRIKSVDVEEGDLVSPKEGERLPLVQIQTGTIQIEIDAAQVELEVREAALQQLKISIPLEVQEAAANVAAAEASLQFAKAELERSQRLFANGGGLSRSELDQALSTFQAASETLKASRVLHLKLEGTQETRIKQSESLVAAQREALRLLEDRKSKYTIVAPFPGAITRKIAEVGQWITSGADAIEIVQMDPIEVTVSVPQAQIQRLQYSLDQATANDQALKAAIVLDSLSEPLEGTVHRIVPQADLMSRAFPVKIRLRNPTTETGYVLKPGMLANATMHIGSTADKLLVAKDALVLNDKTSKLMVLDQTQQPPVAKAVQVRTGHAVGSMIEVIGDVKAGDWVVIEGNERLRPNQTVNILNRDELLKNKPVPATVSQSQQPPADDPENS